jgi:deoxyribonuclease V
MTVVLRPPHRYAWTTDWKTAEFEQAVLADQVELQAFDLQKAGNALAVGVAYRERDQRAFAVGVRSTWNGHTIGGDAYEAGVDVDFPYVPGLFAYREAPAVLAMLEQLDFEPDLVLLDTQGIAHPRRLGLASHVGIVTGIATLGVTRSPLRGRPRGKPPEEGVVVLYDRAEQVGAALYRRHSQPLYASPGHRVDVSTTKQWLRSLPRDGRGLPPAMSRAHTAANRRAKERVNG